MALDRLNVRFKGATTPGGRAGASTQALSQYCVNVAARYDILQHLNRHRMTSIKLNIRQK